MQRAYFIAASGEREKVNGKAVLRCGHRGTGRHFQSGLFHRTFPFLEFLISCSESIRALAIGSATPQFPLYPGESGRTPFKRCCNPLGSPRAVLAVHPQGLGWAGLGWADLLLPPRAVEQLHLSQPLGDHGGEDQPEQHAADQDIIVVVFQDIELFGWIDSGLVDVQPICHNQTG